MHTPFCTDAAPHEVNPQQSRDPQIFFYCTIHTSSSTATASHYHNPQVLLHGRSLALTALLTVIVVYLFIVVGYAFFYDDFVGAEGAEGVCGSLWECFMFGLLNGLRAGGGLGDLLPARSPGLRAAFDFAFFLVIVVIILNIVFGIIIDTFAELRDEKQFIEKDNKKACLICGQSANYFDRYAKGGFNAHVRQTHNMWQYLYFMVYLDQKCNDEYTGQESYVASKLDRDDVSFFPLHKSMELEHIAAPGRCVKSARRRWFVGVLRGWECRGTWDVCMWIQCWAVS